MTPGPLQCAVRPHHASPLRRSFRLERQIATAKASVIRTPATNAHADPNAEPMPRGMPPITIAAANAIPVLARSSTPHFGQANCDWTSLAPIDALQLGHLTEPNIARF